MIKKIKHINKGVIIVICLLVISILLCIRLVTYNISANRIIDQLSYQLTNKEIVDINKDQELDKTIVSYYDTNTKEVNYIEIPSNIIIRYVPSYNDRFHIKLYKSADNLMLGYIRIYRPAWKIEQDFNDTDFINTFISR